MSVTKVPETHKNSSLSEAYTPVQLDSLCPESVMGFNLYLHQDSTTDPVLYCSHDAPLTGEQRRILVDSNVKTMYISKSDSDLYQEYLEEHIGDILNAPDVTAAQKTEVMYGCAQTMLESMFTAPDAPGLMKRSHAMVAEISEFVFRDKDAFPSFLETCALDYAVYSHSVNVFMYSLSLAQRLGYTDRDWLNRFGTGALLHDIGKSRIDPEILHFPGSLTDEQWEIIRMHPVWSWEILTKQGITDEVILNVARSHHEKLTGKGYPDNLPAEEVLDYVRIVTICDIFDALTTKRSYKDAADTFSALKLMREKMADELDFEMFKVFVNMMCSN